MFAPNRFDPQPATKADPYKLETLITWLEKQPAHRRYNFLNCDGACLIDQYLGKNTSTRKYLEFCSATNWDRSIACPYPRTFGAALSRARALAAQS